MTVYYKATRPDGTDFHSGTVNYLEHLVSGEPLPELPGGECCTADVYHASDTPSETLIGGTWPCRLFEVEGEPCSSDVQHKHGFRTLRVLAEIDAHRAFGPNGQAVIAFFEQVSRISAVEFQGTREARNAARAAVSSVSVRIAYSDLSYIIELQERKAAWCVVQNIVCTLVRNLRDDLDVDYYDAARVEDMVMEAGVAILGRDLVTREEFATLTRAWKFLTQDRDEALPE